MESADFQVFPPTIIMDERERGSIRVEMKKLDCKLKIKTLDYGDFLISNRICIERKRGDDLISSIFDNRFFKQLDGLKQLYECPILILESPKKMFQRKFINEKPIYGAIMYVAHKMHIPIIPTNSEAETAQLIYQIALQEQTGGVIPEYNSEKIEDKSSKITREDQIYLLEGLADVGSKKAEKFLELFSTPYFILHSILETKLKYTASGRIKGIDGILSNVKGIGPKFVAKNQQILLSDYVQNKKTKEKLLK
jgi:DNA excision repair protein ERCC-4